MSLLSAGTTLQGEVNLAGQSLGFRFVITAAEDGHFASQNQLCTPDFSAVLEDTPGSGTYSEVDADTYRLVWSDNSSNFEATLNTVTRSMFGTFTQVAGDMTGQSGSFTLSVVA